MYEYRRLCGTYRSDVGTIRLVARYSEDGGRTWTDEDELVVANEGEVNVMSVSLLRMDNGEIALFYVRKNSMRDCIPMMRTSSDEGMTWSEPIACITDREGYFVLK